MPLLKELLGHRGFSTMTEWHSPLDASVEHTHSKPPALVWDRGASIEENWNDDQVLGRKMDFH